MHLRPPPFVPRVRENQSITKYFEDEKDIVSEESSVYTSIKDEGADEHSEEPYSHNAGDRLQQEKFDVGLQACSDADFQRIREHYGASYASWKAERMVTLHRQRLEAGDFQDALQASRVRRGENTKKRPRDKVLRDVVVGKKVMEIRKRKAFFGYTYRRPKPVLLEFGARGATSVVGRRTVRPTILTVDQAGDV